MCKFGLNLFQGGVFEHNFMSIYSIDISVWTKVMDWPTDSAMPRASYRSLSIVLVCVL